MGGGHLTQAITCIQKTFQPGLREAQPLDKMDLVVLLELRYQGSGSCSEGANQNNFIPAQCSQIAVPQPAASPDSVDTHSWYSPSDLLTLKLWDGVTVKSSLAGLPDDSNAHWNLQTNAPHL